MKELGGLQRSTLSDEDRQALQFAALLGYRFDSLLLALAMGADVAMLIASLKRCRDAGIIVVQDDDGFRWKFNHALVHQSFADSVPEDRKREYHTRALGALETIADSVSKLDQLAYHAVESGDQEKARIYNERAGDAAFHIRALPEAQRYFAVALAVANDDFAKIRLQGKIVSAKGRSRISS
ncbi:MAG: hypothetical protein M3R51_05425 [Candidatus Eremiobacteraeota bacterium]|nr:hypothetical protein [Candidatus Eremiobacteraeota bacterium]